MSHPLESDSHIMAKEKRYYQFELYLLDADLHQVKAHAEATAAFKIGSKIAKDSYKEPEDDLEFTVEQGCFHLDIPFTEARVDDYIAARDRVTGYTTMYGASPECRVRHDLFHDALKAKPSIKENHFRVFAAMTAVMGGDSFKPISRERLHAGACGWKNAEIPAEWPIRLPFNCLQKVTKKIAEMGLCSSHYDAVGRRHCYYTISKSKEQLIQLVKAHLEAKAERKRSRSSTAGAESKCV